jgi:formylglycine-generating enzyme required for sulfatase activity
MLVKKRSFVYNKKDFFTSRGDFMHSQVSIPDGFKYIPGGTFMMGSPSDEVDREDREIPHKVTVSPFYMGMYQVTHKEWYEIMGKGSNKKDEFKGDDLPVEGMSWYGAVEYCNKLSIEEGLTPAYTIDRHQWDKNNTSQHDSLHWLVAWDQSANGYRLPTEAEWEYACRAGTTTPFYTGDNITTNHANYNGNYPYNNGPSGEYRKKPWPVGCGVSNKFGLYDMHGNAWEWCWDWYGDYSADSQIDPTGAVSGAYRVVRGGSWLSLGKNLRSARRDYDIPSDSEYDLGFRVARSATLTKGKGWK